MNESTKFEGTREVRDALEEFDDVNAADLEAAEKQERRRKRRDAHLSINDQPADASMAANAREEFTKLWREKVGNPYIPGRILKAYGGDKKKLLEDLSAIGLTPPNESVANWRIRNVDYAQTGGQFVSQEKIDPILDELAKDNSPENLKRLEKKALDIILPSEKPESPKPPAKKSSEKAPDMPGKQTPEAVESVSRTPDGKEYYTPSQLRKAVQEVIDRRKIAYADDEEAFLGEFEGVFTPNLINKPYRLITLVREQRTRVEDLVREKGLDDSYAEAIKSFNDAKASIEYELNREDQRNSPAGLLNLENAAAIAVKAILDAKRLIKELEEVPTPTDNAEIEATEPTTQQKLNNDTGLNSQDQVLKRAKSDLDAEGKRIQKEIDEIKRKAGELDHKLSQKQQNMKREEDLPVENVKPAPLPGMPWWYKKDTSPTSDEEDGEKIASAVSRAEPVDEPQNEVGKARKTDPTMKVNLLRRDRADTTLTTDAERFLYEWKSGKRDLPPELTDELKDLLLANGFNIAPDEWDEITPEIAADMLEGNAKKRADSPSKRFWKKVMGTPEQALDSAAEKLEKAEAYLNKRSLELGLKWKNASTKKKVLIGLGAGLLAAGAGAGVGATLGVGAGAAVAGSGRLAWRFISAGLAGLGTYAGLEAASWEREKLGQEQKWAHKHSKLTGAMAGGLVLAIGTAASEGVDAIMNTDAADRATQTIGKLWNSLWQKHIEIKVATAAGEVGASVGEFSTEEIENKTRDFIAELDKRGSELGDRLDDALSASTESPDATTGPAAAEIVSPATPPESPADGAGTSPEAETVETPSVEAPEPQPITMEAGGSVWKAAYELGEKAGLSSSQIYEMLENSTHSVDGKEVSLLKLDLVHEGDTLAISNDPEPHFEFTDKAGDGLEAGTDLPGETEAHSPTAGESGEIESPQIEEVEIRGESTVNLSEGDITEQELSPETAKQATPPQEITPQFLETQVRDMLRADLERIYDDHYHWIVGETDPWNDIKEFAAKDVIRGDLNENWDLRQLFAGKYGSDHRELRDYIQGLMDKTNLVPEKNEKVQNFIIRMADKLISNKYSS